jgi:2-octaprenyl-6-methoxyphenol hydroxylase
MMAQEDSIVIVGGGPVGALLALSLQQNGIPFSMLEARAKGASHSDTRALALSDGSRLILEKLNIWSEIEGQATEIKSIHVSQHGGFGRTKLEAAEHKLPALGYVLPYGALTKALDAALDLNHVLYDAVATEVRQLPKMTEVFFKQVDIEISISSSLAVIADGGRSTQLHRADEAGVSERHDLTLGAIIGEEIEHAVFRRLEEGLAVADGGGFRSHRHRGPRLTPCSPTWLYRSGVP